MSNKKQGPNSDEEGASLDVEVSSPEVLIYRIETRFAEELPDGSKLVWTQTNELRIRRGRRFRARIRLPRWVLVGGVVLLTVAIGLIAVGPGEVWEWLTKVIDRLIN